MAKLGVWLVMLLMLTGNALAQLADIKTEPLQIFSGSGVHSFMVEVPTTAAGLERGLMYRKSLADKAGMLFDFGDASLPRNMWMKNTYIPLDMLFIGAEGQVLKIVANTKPQSEVIISSDTPARAVLELKGGSAKRLGIQVGDRVMHPSFMAPEALPPTKNAR